MRFLLLLLCVASAVAAEVESFSPQGAVTQVRQAKARFSAPMIKFGDPRLADPFDVNCGDLAGKGRWVDDRNWVYDFDADVPAAHSCTFSLTHGLHALDGAALVPEQFVFTTGGPEVGEFWPQGGESISEEQTFLATFTAAPDPGSLLAKARCEVNGIAERMPVVILPKEQRDTFLAGLYGKDKHRWPSFSFALRCQRPLPAGANGMMVFDAGLASANGARTSAAMQENFRVRDKFTASIVCEHTNSKAGCVPILPIRLVLSEPIRLDAARNIAMTSADGKQRWAGEPVQSELLDETDASGKRISTQLVTAMRFKPPFAERTSLRVTLPVDLRDAYGRPLTNAKQFPLNVAVDAYPPLAKFAANFGIVEREVGALPVTVRNVGELMRADKPQGAVSKLIDMAKSAVGQEAKAAPAYTLPYRQLTLTSDADIMAWYQKLTRKGGWDEISLLRDDPKAQVLKLPTAQDDREAEVIGMPLAKSGLTVVEVESGRLGGRLYDKAAPMFVRSGGLTTNLSVHFRRGTDDALVWVTTLDKGWLVNAASVSIYDCKGKQLATGKTDNKGVWQYAKPLPRERYDCPLYVFAHLADDVSFVLSEWREGIEPWRFGIPTASDRRDRTLYHAILDRGLYRAGETVSMKLIAREQTAEGFGASADAQLGTQLRLRHLGSDDSVVMPVSWKGGVAEASWKVPVDAKLGQYEIALERKRGKDAVQVGDAGSFAVSEFRVPLMRGMLKLPVDPVAVDKVDAVVQVQYLAGGPAAGAPVKLRALLTPNGSRQIDGFDGYAFANGDVAPIVRQGGTTDGEDEGLEESADEGRTLAPQDTTLDKAGGATLSLTGWSAVTVPTTLQSEVEYSDPNGEVRTASATTTLWPAALQVGYAFESPRKNGGKLPIRMAVASLAGKPLAGRAVKAEAWVRETYSHRRRLVGGFYSYRSETRFVPLGQVCAGKTDAHGLFACEMAPKRRGNVLIRVSAQDDAGHLSMANGEVWVPGEGEDAWWETGDGDRIDLFPDKKHYEPGEVASVRVNMPFREGTALIAIEREKVLTWQTQQLTAANPVVRVPILPNYGPNVYVSVLVVRGRVAEPAPTALVDLGRPAYKLGVAKLAVGDRGYRLNVKVTSDKALYQVRDKAHVSIAVQAADGKPLTKGSEVALAAVDEGLLQLRPNTSWNVLAAMLGERPYSFYTATMQGQVIGKRHFGRKAVPVGGGGGRSSTRELFDTLLLWKARVPLDAQGKAGVDVPLNDSLTSFRIVAVATAGSDHFGSGETSIRASKDVMLFSGLATTVREEDKFDAAFTIRNTTSHPVQLNVSAKAEGASALAPQTLALEGGAARELTWPVNVPIGIDKLGWTLEAKGDDGHVYDRLVVKQAVQPAVPVRVLQATLAQLAPDYHLPIERPKDAIVGRGSVRVILSPSLTASLDGVDAYFRAYPYGCLEQLTSKAVGMNDEALWRVTVNRLDSYLDGDGLAKFFPIMQYGSPALTAHLLRLSAERGWELPDKGLARMQAGVIAYLEGRTHYPRRFANSTWEAGDRLDMLSGLAPYGALRPAMLDGMIVEPNRWSNATLLDWIAVVDALNDLPKRTEKLREARQILSARLDLSGTTLNFSSGMADDWWRELDSTDTIGARMLIDALHHDTATLDLGRLARGLAARQHRGHWDTTTGNAWGALAVREFAGKVEGGAPTGSVLAKLGAEQKLDWASQPKGGTFDLPWPDKAGELNLQQQGNGKPWAVVQARSALPLAAPFNAGYRIDKHWEPVEAKGKSFGRGDVWRVRLTIEAQADAGWVVVDDPIPAGSTLLGKGLGGESTLLARGEQRQGDWPVFEERGETAYHAYYDSMSKGTHVIEYTIRLGARGEFRLPATHVEAMYAPERLGETPNAVMRID